MVMATIASRDFDWRPDVVASDDPEAFNPEYTVEGAAITEIQSVKSSFADLPSAGIWQDRKESDEAMLEQIGGDWRGFGVGY